MFVLETIPKVGIFCRNYVFSMPGIFLKCFCLVNHVGINVTREFQDGHKILKRIVAASTLLILNNITFLASKIFEEGRIFFGYIINPDDIGTDDSLDLKFKKTELYLRSCSKWIFNKM